MLFISPMVLAPIEADIVGSYHVAELCLLLVPD